MHINKIAAKAAQYNKVSRIDTAKHIEANRVENKQQAAKTESTKVTISHEAIKLLAQHEQEQVQMSKRLSVDK